MDRVRNIAGQLTGSPAAQAPTSGPRTIRRAVVVDGCRTPFVKSFGKLMHVDTIGLGVAAVRGLLEKTKLDPALIEEVIWGSVVTKSSAPNIAREIALDLGLPPHVPGVTVSRYGLASSCCPPLICAEDSACLSGLQAIEQAVMLVETGNADVVIAGGGDSLSNGELPLPRDLTLALGKYSMGGGNKKGWTGVRELLNQAGPIGSWLPQKTEIAERSTGKTMGFHADLMAEINHVPRAAQDQLAAQSHAKAAAATRSGKFRGEIVPVKNPKNGKMVAGDDLIRSRIDPGKISKLDPVFRKAVDHGTVTAATSSPLTDGASAVLIMSETKARELGFPTDVSFRGFVTTGVDPYPQLLLAPALAIPRALDRAGLRLADIDLIEIHEAFAAQVLATIKCIEDPGFCREILHRSGPVGTVDMNKVNVNGGSIAIGHPFAATGGRIVTTAAAELRRSKKRHCLISICAAGGLGGVAILERTPN